MYKIEKYNFGWSQSKPRVTITLGQHWGNIASGPEASSIPSQPLSSCPAIPAPSEEPLSL